MNIKELIATKLEERKTITEYHLTTKKTQASVLRSIPTRPPQKILSFGLMSAPSNHEFFRLMEVSDKNFRSIRHLELPDHTPLKTPKNFVLETMAIWVFRRAQRSRKLPEAWFRVPAKLS